MIGLLDIKEGGSTLFKVYTQDFYRSIGTFECFIAVSQTLIIADIKN